MERKEKKVGSRVTNHQLSRMVSAMEAAPDIANNLVKGPQTAFWRKVAKDLNEFGPVVRDPSSWKRVWFDYKFSVKKRVRRYNESVAAGIYPKPFSTIHRRVVRLLKMDVRKVKEDVGSGSEDMSSDGIFRITVTKSTVEDQADSNLPSTMLHDASDDNMNPLQRRSTPRAISACQKRLENLPNITVVKRRHDQDPLANGTNNHSVDEESNPAPCVSTRKRARDEHFQMALETNKATIAVINESIEANKELTAEMRAVKQSCDELNENLKNVNSTLQELIEVLRNK